MYKICTYYFFEVAASTYSFFLFAGDRQVPITSKQEKIIRHKMLKKPLGKTNMYKICTCTFFQVAVSTYSFFLFASDRHVPITSKQKKRIRHKILKKLLEKHNMYKFCTYYFFKQLFQHFATYSFLLFAGDSQVPIASKQKKVIRHKMLKKLLGKINMYKFVRITFSTQLFQHFVTYYILLFAGDRHLPITSKLFIPPPPPRAPPPPKKIK